MPRSTSVAIAVVALVVGSFAASAQNQIEAIAKTTPEQRAKLTRCIRSLHSGQGT